MSRKMLNLLIILALALGMPASVLAQDEGPQAPEIDVSALALEFPVEVAPELVRAEGEVEIVIRLVDEPLAVVVGAGAKQKGIKLTAAQQRSYTNALAQKQADLLRQVQALGGVEMGRVRLALNAVIVRVDASKVVQIAGLPGVRAVYPLGEYEKDLSSTVPYIGATAVQEMGFDGTGVRVAVFDSGIDYHHYNLGGSGDPADYWANDPTIIEPGSFPTAKVIGGYDFTGSEWPSGPRMEDPDPLDDGPARGHGTNVADIIAGKEGVAPGALLYALKVCSSVSSSCNGVALLLSFDWVLDPNGDGDISDAVDVINLSLGASYGQRENSTSLASANAVRYGVVVVASAGNSADRPFITGSPSSTPEVISVAQTQVPSAVLMPLVINTPAHIAGPRLNTATVDWAPIGDGFTGDVAFVGRGCIGDPYLADPAGKVALIDRGVCSISQKVDRAAKAGAVAVLLGLVAPGDAVTFSQGDGDTFVPTLVIILADSNAIKGALSAGYVVNVSVSNDFVVSLAGGMVGSSSRGPSYSHVQIKPDIGAPGASVSAVAGSGTGVRAFGGTSGAAPMVSGAAALLLQAYPGRSPLEIKSVLMNTGETNVYTNPGTMPGVLAPVTRIGGGEVRVNQALTAKTAAWSADEPAGSLSFGYQALTGSKTFTKKVVLRNYTNKAVTYSVTPTFRYENDALSGAVSVVVPKSVRVNANNSAVFNVQLKVDASKLPLWPFYGAANHGNGALLQSVEFDGYLHIAGGGDTIHMPWHILPHRSAEVTPASDSVTLADGAGVLSLSNAGGAVNGWVDVFSLLGTSGRIPPPYLPEDGDSFAVIDLKHFGARQAGANVVQFAISTYGTRSHPAYPAEFDVYLDTDRDGNYDAVIWTQELTGFGATGQTVVYVQNFNTGVGGAYYFAGADLRSGNMILTAPMSVLGLTAGATFDVDVYAFDNYFTGWMSDSITGMTYTLNAPRFVPSAWALSVPVGGSLNLGVNYNPAGNMYSPSQSGLLLMYGDAREQRESDAIYVNMP
jgi:minor extracellular serine protease Vpr